MPKDGFIYKISRDQLKGIKPFQPLGRAWPSGKQIASASTQQSIAVKNQARFKGRCWILGCLIGGFRQYCTISEITPNEPTELTKFIMMIKHPSKHIPRACPTLCCSTFAQHYPSWLLLLLAMVQNGKTRLRWFQVFQKRKEGGQWQPLRKC